GSRGAPRGAALQLLIAPAVDPSTLSSISGAVTFADFAALALEFARAPQAPAVSAELCLLNNARLRARGSAREWRRGTRNGGDAGTGNHQYSQQNVVHRSSIRL